MSGEMLPPKLESGRLRETTLPGCQRLHFTPAQRQKSELLPFHELSAPESSDSASLNASSASRSLCSPASEDEEDTGQNVRSASSSRVSVERRVAMVGV